MDGIQDLGQRIVEAARLAVAVHLYESAGHGSAVARRAASEILRRRVEIGGAGPRDAGNPRLGDIVTDDEWEGLMGRGDDQDADNDRDPSR